MIRCRYATLRTLLAQPHLALISVWNPSFLTLLMEVLHVHAARLIDDLEEGVCRIPARDEGMDSDAQRERQAAMDAVITRLPFTRQPRRAQFLRGVLCDEGRLRPRALWPGLRLISAWTDAHAAHFLPPLSAQLDGVEIQGKGLLATEGVVTMPLFDAPAPVLAVRSHFYEFIELDQPNRRPRLAHDLETQKTYEVVISTSGGLLRYRTGDSVRVEGSYRTTPCLRFLGRADEVSDLVGEKLSGTRVSDVLSCAVRTTLIQQSRFLMLAPELSSPPHYRLFVEADVSRENLRALCRVVESELCEGHHYAYARELGQLGPVRVVRVLDGIRRYEQGCIQLGQRAGDIKPVALHRTPGWSTRFAETEVIP